MLFIQSSERGKDLVEWVWVGGVASVWRENLLWVGLATKGIGIFGRTVGRESIGRRSGSTQFLLPVLCNVAVIDWTDVRSGKLRESVQDHAGRG